MYVTVVVLMLGAASVFATGVVCGSWIRGEKARDDEAELVRKLRVVRATYFKHLRACRDEGWRERGARRVLSDLERP